MILYFAYGANLSKESMKYRCPDATPIQPIELRDWALAFADHATIVPAPGESVQGGIWAITKQCERSLDMFEGYPVYYTKETLEQDGLKFMVYIMNPPLYGNPSAGYVNIIRQGYNDWNLDQAQLDYALTNNQKGIHEWDHQQLYTNFI